MTNAAKNIIIICVILLFEEEVIIRFLNGWLPYCLFFVIIKLQFDKMPRPSFHTGNNNSLERYWVEDQKLSWEQAWKLKGLAARGRQSQNFQNSNIWHTLDQTMICLAQKLISPKL